ncbi:MULTISPECIES: hypothetical protein [unclassified Streptomyces]|uniref:hypothetical protein n=1 Tax=unclassified Streptomyces TaxID=2593676 RepID=UPI00344EF497
MSAYELSDPGTRDYRTQAHKDYLDSRIEAADDAEARVIEFMSQHARVVDPENCTDADLQRAFGANWRAAATVVQQAADLRREQAERIADYSLPEWELDDLTDRAMREAGPALDFWDSVGDAGDAATECMFSRGDVYWETRNAYLAALMAAVAGSAISDALSREMTHAWRLAFTD